jgi:hypothetical protein
MFVTIQSICNILVIKATVQLVHIHTTLQVKVIRVVIQHLQLWCAVEIELKYCTDIQFVCVFNLYISTLAVLKVADLSSPFVLLCSLDSCVLILDII